MGYVPVPFEVLKRRGRVIGIDFIFLAIDWAGAFFSLMALGMRDFFPFQIEADSARSVAQNTFDLIGGVLYAACAAIEISIVLSQLIWLFRTRAIRKRAKNAELSWEEFSEAQEWEDKRWRLNWNITFSTHTHITDTGLPKPLDDLEGNTSGEECQKPHADQCIK